MAKSVSSTENKITQSIDAGKTLFELGKLYSERGDFDLAISNLVKAAEFFNSEKNFDYYLKTQNLLLRMYAEREDHANINATKERLQDLVLKEGIELNSKTYYTLGICATYKNQLDLSLEYFQKSLALALSVDNKEDMCYAINGIAIVYFTMGRNSDALKEIYNLQVFFEVLPLASLKFSVQILNGAILREQGRYEQSLEVLMECYNTLKESKNMYMYLYLLYNIGLTYKAMSNMDIARLYLNLAKKAVDSKNLVQLTKRIDHHLEELGVKSHSDYDLVFNPVSKSVVERKKGKIDFKNQFILLDLLHLFIRNPGQTYSKEILVKKIWSQEYNPQIHDNKIYVTIKRLRQLIEPDYDKPKYIFRSKNGYYLSKSIKVLMEQTH